MHRIRPASAIAILLSLLTLRSSHFAFAQCAPDALVTAIPNPASFNNAFGNSVAIDGNIAVIGAWLDSAPVVLLGKARTYNASTGELLSNLVNPDPVVNDDFGGAVAIAFGFAVVGAPRADISGVNGAGKAYVYNATTGALVTSLVTRTPNAGGRFGCAVAASGLQVVVGASGDDPDVTDISPGAAYVYNTLSSAPVWTLANPEPGDGDEFGAAVTLYGNVAVIGARLDDAPGAVNAGAAFVFATGSGELITKLENPDPDTGDEFGQAVATDGVIALVGAHQDDAGAVNGGTVYVFNAMTGALLRTLDNPPNSNPGGDTFGYSVSLSDGLAVISAPNEDPGDITAAGTAYIFDIATGARLTTLNVALPGVYDNFGTSVAISSNLALVGAPFFSSDGGQTNSGSAFVYSCAPGVGRQAGDFDRTGCAGIDDFLFLLDNWQTISVIGAPEIGINDFLTLLDNWQTGPACP